MFYKFSLFILMLISLLTTNIEAKIREFETTRLQSTSGAGVATVLVNETSILNPAPIVFIPVSSFYYQKGRSLVDSESKLRNEPFSDGQSQMYLLSDSTSALKGTFSYQDHSENHQRRKRYTSSIATSIGPKTSFGVLYRYTIDKEYDDENRFHQAVLGFTHIQSNELSIGGVLVDPFISHNGDSRAIFGFQYALTGNLFLIVDGGTNFKQKPEENTLSKYGLQINFFQDLYLRAGQFYDKNTNLKGRSWGISWIGPRLSLEYAYKTSELIKNNTDDLYENEQIIESSFSVALLF